jgi:hypothetical protein
LKILFRIILLFLSISLASACQVGRGTPAVPTATFPPPGPPPVKFSGQGPAQQSIQWSGPAILHLTAGRGSQPFVATLISGLEIQPLENAAGVVDDYRSYAFTAPGSASLTILGDRAWAVTVYPLDPRYFPRVQPPGKYQGNGSAVILLVGKSGVATFENSRAQDFHAWAYLPAGVGKELAITPGGDYKGKSVLPKGAGWIVVSARGPWSVEIQPPCCEVPAGGY